MEPGQKVTVKTLPRVDGKKLFEAVKKKSGGKITKLLNAHPNPTTMNNKNNKDQPKKVCTTSFWFPIFVVSKYSLTFSQMM